MSLLQRPSRGRQLLLDALDPVLDPVDLAPQVEDSQGSSPPVPEPVGVATGDPDELGEGRAVQAVQKGVRRPRELVEEQLGVGQDGGGRWVCASREEVVTESFEARYLQNYSRFDHEMDQCLSINCLFI